MSDNKIIFSMVGVGKVYPPNRQVLKDIYLSFFYGAKIGVLGLNGAGKSTSPAASSPASTRTTSARSPCRRGSRSAISRRNRNWIRRRP